MTIQHDDPTVREVSALVTNAMEGWKQEVAAKVSGCAAGTIRRAMRGDNVTVQSLSRMAKGLGYRVQISFVKE